MANDLSIFRFDTSHIRDLKKCGLSDRVIAALESRVLPVIHSTLSSTPMGGAKKILPKITRKAKQLIDLMDEIEIDSREMKFARYLLLETDYGDRARTEVKTRKKPNNLQLSELVQEVRRLATLTEDACNKLKGKQSRHREATPYSISALEEVLMSEWTAEYTDNGRPLPAYPYIVSRADKSKFRQIASICFYAAGHSTEDPERAIRAYLEVESKSDEWIRYILSDENSKDGQ